MSPKQGNAAAAMAVAAKRKPLYEKKPLAIGRDQGRKRREESTAELRRIKRSEGLKSKRSNGAPSSSGPVASPSPFLLELRKCQHNQTEVINLLAKHIISHDTSVQLAVTVQLRKMLSIPEKAPVEQVIEAGFIPHLVELMRKSTNHEILSEALWALTNITSGTSEQAAAVVEKGAVPLLVKLLYSSNNSVREQALWTLGNIAGDCTRYRDTVLSEGAMPNLLSLLREGIGISMLKVATWTLSNFCRGRPLPAFELVKASIPTLAKLIYEDDKEVLGNVCWTLLFLSEEKSHEDLQEIVDGVSFNRIVELLRHRCLSICTSALRFIGNLVAGTEAQTQLVIDSGVLLRIYSLMTTRDDLKPYIKKDICWMVSNIAAGTKDQIQAVIDSGIIPLLVTYIEKEELDIKEEVVWALCNATFGEDPAQIEYLVKQRCVKPICGMLACSDVRIMSVCLEAIENILRASENNKKDTNKYRFLIREAANMTDFVALQSHWNPHICEKAGRIMHDYLADAESNEVQRTKLQHDFQAFNVC